MDEKVNSEEVKKFAKEIGAIFVLTSALTSVGIENLFMDIGKKFLDNNKIEKSVKDNKGDKGVKLNIYNEKKKKKSCC